MQFHYLARGVILQNGKVLLAHQKGAGNTFLPGGHINMGEKTEAALLREVMEELGVAAIIGRFIGAVECVYASAGQENHELNLVFELEIPGLEPSRAPGSRESHLEFLWSAPEELKAHNLLPAPLIECIRGRGQGGGCYWGSDFERFGEAA